MKEETERLQTLLDFGIKPFAQLYRAEQPIQYSKAWKELQCKWCRPAAMLAKKKND